MNGVVKLICVSVLALIFFGYWAGLIFVIDLILLGILSYFKPDWFR